MPARGEWAWFPAFRRPTWQGLLGLLILLGSIPARLLAAPPPPVPLEQEAAWRIADFAPDAGVLRRLVFDVAFQTNNTAWFAASDGLYRFDGYHWSHFTTAHGLPSNFVRAVAVARDGAIWIGTDRGAGVFLPEAARFDPRGTVGRLAGPNIRRIEETTDGTLWFSCDRWPDPTHAGGLTRLKDGDFRTYGVADGLPSDHVFSVFEQSGGRVVVLTQSGPAVLDGDRWTPLAEPGYPAGDQAWLWCEAPDGQVFAAGSQTVLTFSGGRWHPCPGPGPAGRSPLCVARDGSVIRGIADEQGAVFFARWDGTGFVQASTTVPGSGRHMHVLRQAPDGSVWAVGRGTILRWEYLPGVWSSRPDLPRPVLEDRKHRVWFADSSRAAYVGDSGTREHPDLHAPLVEDADGGIWAASDHGVVHLPDERPIRVPPDVCGIATLVNGLTDQAGALWLHGLDPDGQQVLSRRQPGGWTIFRGEVLDGRTVDSMSADPRDGLWMVLARADSSDYRVFRATADGLRPAEIEGTLPALHGIRITVGGNHAYLHGYGGLWESSLSEPLRFAPPATDASGVVSRAAGDARVTVFLIQESVDGRAAIVLRRGEEWLRQPVNYGETLALSPEGWLMVADGDEFVLWQSREWSSPTYVSLPTDTTITSLVRTSDGLYWIGTTQGTLRFAPGQRLPETVLSGTAASRNGLLTGLQASAIAPFSPRSDGKRYSFIWRIDGGRWSDYGDWPASGLPAGPLGVGHHLLEVRARDGLGNEDPTPAEHAFEIRPAPIQERPWFRPLLAGIGVGLVGLIVALADTSRRLFRHAGRLEDQVRERTVELLSDLAQRERMSEALLESDARLRANLENTPNVAIQWYDREGRVTYWNPASEALYGWAASEVLGRTLDESILGPSEARQFQQVLDRIRETGQPVGPYEMGVRRRDGSPCWILATTFGIPLSPGQAGFACMDVDITELKQNERVQQAIIRISEVALAAKNLDEMFPALHQVIGELMPATNFYVAILDHDGTHLRFPYYRDERCPPPPTRRLRRGLSERVLHQGRPLLATSEELQRLVQSGEVDTEAPLPTSWLGVPLRTHETAIGVMVVHSYDPSTRYRERERDLLFLVSYHVANAIQRKRAESENARLQARLVQAQKMESVGRLAGGVAHDFNNMLQAILGNVDLAMQHARPASELADDLQEIRHAAERSASLTAQLLAFARKQTISPRLLDLNETVARSLKLLRRLIGEDIHLAWMPGPNLWPVRLDPSQVDQVLANLCVNARDAIRGTGRITIETSNASLDPASASLHADGLPGDYVLLSVSDDGEGMSEETLGHLFEPFYTTKEVGDGTGLGLATVYGIVKQNGGVISVDSQPNQGSTFRIFLPRATPPAASPPAQSTAVPSPRGTETILLVEDEAQILHLGRRVLEQRGYAVLAAGTPQAALALAASHPGPIHLLITDVVMPGLNGRELRDRLLELRPDLRCLFMSGYTANVIAHHGVLDEGVDFLQKPFTVDSLAERVRDMLDRPATVHPVPEPPSAVRRPRDGQPSTHALLSPPPAQDP